MSLKIDIKSTDGKVTGNIDLPTEIFDAQANIPLIHQVVVAQLAAARAGTAKTKNRGEVSGTGKKPFKQKGTGRKLAQCSLLFVLKQKAHRNIGSIKLNSCNDLRSVTEAKLAQRYRPYSGPDLLASLCNLKRGLRNFLTGVAGHSAPGDEIRFGSWIVAQKLEGKTRIFSL